MSHSIKPLFEEPIHWLPGCLLDGDAELFCLHRLIGVLPQIIVDRPPPVFFPDGFSQHVKDRCPTRISVVVENCVFVLVVICNDRATVTLRPGSVVGILIAFDIAI